MLQQISHMFWSTTFEKKPNEMMLSITCLTMRVVHIKVLHVGHRQLSWSNHAIRWTKWQTSTNISDNGANYVGAERELADYVQRGTEKGWKDI